MQTSNGIGEPRQFRREILPPSDRSLHLRTAHWRTEAWAGVLRGLSLLAVGGVAGFLVIDSTSAVLLLTLVILSIGFLCLPKRTPFLATTRPYRWVPAYWCVLLFISNIKFTTEVRSPLLAATGNLSPDNRRELLAYALIAATLVAASFHRRLSHLDRKTWPLFAWPLFAVASSAWSLIPVFTLVRATQLLIVVALTLFSLRVAKAHPGIGQRIAADTLRGFLLITSALTVWGFVDRSAWENSKTRRFMWPTGEHPISVGLVIGAALLVLIVGGTALSRLPRLVHASLAVLFTVALILGHNRSVLVSTVVGLLVVLWLRGKDSVAHRYLALPALLYGGLILALIAGSTVLSYFERSESFQLISTLTGRTTLWEAAIQQLQTPLQWLRGFGYGSPRVILAPLFSWAGQAHNSLIEILLGTGIIGIMLAVVILWVIGHGVLSTPTTPRATRPVEAAIFVYLLVVGTTEALLLPGFAFTMFLFLFFAASCDARAAWAGGDWHPKLSYNRSRRLRAGTVAN